LLLQQYGLNIEPQAQASMGLLFGAASFFCNPASPIGFPTQRGRSAKLSGRFDLSRPYAKHGPLLIVMGILRPHWHQNGGFASKFSE